MDIQSIKQRFGIIGNSPLMNRAIDIAAQVANTELSVLVTGESGVGKEFFPKIIHNLSSRKHAPYVAINCGAIPEGTIDSELFGHEKGAFTDAREARKGYFEEANGGTIFLDEVAELPLSTQVRLLRVLETGEFLKVGSSKALKTNVRVVAATNVNIPEAIHKGSFREDLFYRLNSIAIQVPPLRERKEDIPLLFRKFSSDLSEKYRMPLLQLSEDALYYLVNYPWRGNVRELKNITEQITIIEKDRLISLDKLREYLPQTSGYDLPVLFGQKESTGLSEREILYSLLFDMQKDVHELKRVIASILKKDELTLDVSSGMQTPTQSEPGPEAFMIIPSSNKPIGGLVNKHHYQNPPLYPTYKPSFSGDSFSAPQKTTETQESGNFDTLSLEKREKELILKALEKNHGNRRKAAEDLGISERTIYRKIKDYEIEIN